MSLAEMENVLHSCPAKHDPELVYQLAAYYLHLIGLSLNALLLILVHKYSGGNTGAYRTIYRVTCVVDFFVILASIVYQQVFTRRDTNATESRETLAQGGLGLGEILVLFFRVY